MREDEENPEIRRERTRQRELKGNSLGKEEYN